MNETYYFHYTEKNELPLDFEFQEGYRYSFVFKTSGINRYKATLRFKEDHWICRNCFLKEDKIIIKLRADKLPPGKLLCHVSKFDAVTGDLVEFLEIDPHCILTYNHDKEPSPISEIDEQQSRDIIALNDRCDKINERISKIIFGDLDEELFFQADWNAEQGQSGYIANKPDLLTEDRLLWERGTGIDSLVVKNANNKAEAENSIAEGRNTRAAGKNSHAEGLKTDATGDNSHAEGNETIASGEDSHAEGRTTEAKGLDSHAEGFGSRATGKYSHVEGNHTYTTNDGEHAEGNYNASNSDTLSSIGNGISGFRHNAFEVKKDGSVLIADVNGKGEVHEKPMLNLQDGFVDLNNLKSWRNALNGQKSFKYWTLDPKDVGIEVKATSVDLYTGQTGSSETQFILAAATSNTAGLMTATDKTSLENLKIFENLSNMVKNYAGWPFVAAVGENLTHNSDNIRINYTKRRFDSNSVIPSTSSYFTLNAATSTTAGVMTAEDKTKLDNFQSELNKKANKDDIESIETVKDYLTSAGTFVKEVMIEQMEDRFRIQSRSINTNTGEQILSPYAGGVYPATSEKAGLMSKEDKTKLDDINLDEFVYGEPVVALPDYKDADLEKFKKELFIDLWNDACILKDYATTAKSFGKYDIDNAPDKDKPFYLNGLWFSYEEAIAIYNEKVNFAPYDYRGLYKGCNLKTILPFHVVSTLVYDVSHFFYGASNLEIVESTTTTIGRALICSDMSSFLRNCYSLKTLNIWLNLSNVGSMSNAFKGCDSLEYLRIINLKKNISFEECPKLDYDSLKFMINYASNITPITITVHPDVYAKLTDESNAEWYKVNQDALAKNILFAS